MITIRLCSLVLLVVVVASGPSMAQSVHELARRDSIEPFILDSIEIVTGEVFTYQRGILSTLGDILNALHVVTAEGVIRDEIYFAYGDTITAHDLNELERNLRARNLFSEISLEVTPYQGEEGYEYRYSILRVVTRDKWSLLGAIGYDLYRDEAVYIASASESNLFGTGITLAVGAEHAPKVTDRPWRLSGAVVEPNIAGSFLRVGASVAASKLETVGRLSVERPFYRDAAGYAFGVASRYFTGDDVFYFSNPDGPATVLQVPTDRADVAASFSLRHGESADVFRSSAQVIAHSTTYPGDTIPAVPTRAFDNTVGLYLGISSVRRRYVVFSDVDFDGDLLVPIGSSGSVTLGRTFAHTSGTDNLFYIGAEASLSELVNRQLYLYGRVAAGTGVEQKQTRYTIQTVDAGALWLVDPGVVAARFEQTTVWNWPRYIFNPLDETSGLRGYDQLRFLGDSRIAGNLEYRLFPVFEIPFFEVGLTAFYDIGAVWQQGRKLSDAQFHSSAGLGIRIAGSETRLNSGLWRLDFPIAFDGDGIRLNRIIAGFSFSTSEFFTPFGGIAHRPPAPYQP